MTPGTSAGSRAANQYRARTPKPANQTSVVLVQQTNPKPVRCYEIWAGGCQAPVQPPRWDHGKHPTPQMCWQTAKSDQAQPAALTQLAHSSEFGVRTLVAANPNTLAETLEQLSYDPACCQQVASNTSTPTAILESMSEDLSYVVRELVAANSNTPLPTLEKLLRDPLGWIAQAAAANPSLPAATLAMWQLTR